MKNKSFLTGILIVIAGAIVIVSLLSYSYFSYLNTPVYFNEAKKEAAKTLYNKVMAVDMDKNYPKTPDEVMSYYLDINKLIYSDMIVDESIFEDVVVQMRKLFGPEMIEKNDYDTQLNTILNAVSQLKELNVYQSSYEMLPTIYNTLEARVCYIRVKQTYSNNESFYWEYQLERILPENYWKIIRFESTDENYKTAVWE